MRTLVHLSDLHFGRADEALLEPLRDAVRSAAPDLVVVSGDLTQRARSEQFEQAREYLATLPRPQLVVPGNHDVPLYNLFARFLRPLAKFRRHITGDLDPFHVDDEIAVAGMNTARSLTIKDGRVNEAQVARLCERFAALGDHIVKVVVTHHPFDLEPGRDNDDLVWRARMAMEAFAKCGADILLSGHMHATRAGDTSLRYPLGDYAALTIQAGTATSTRGRGEANAFNVIRIDHALVRLESLAWDAEAQRFAIHSQSAFERHGQGWREMEQTPA